METKKATTIRLSESSRLAIVRLASERGISQGELIEKMIQKEDGVNDVYPVLEHCINTISNGESEIEYWFYDQDEPDNIREIKDRLALCQNILIDTPEVKNDDRSYSDVPELDDFPISRFPFSAELDDAPISRFPFSAWSKKFEVIINALKK